MGAKKHLAVRYWQEPTSYCLRVNLEWLRRKDVRGHWIGGPLSFEVGIGPYRIRVARMYACLPRYAAGR